MLKTKRRFFGNIVGHVNDVSDPASLMDWTAQQFDPHWIGTKSNKSNTNGAAADLKAFWMQRI